MDPLLSLRGLSAGYGGKAVIRDVSLDIAAGEFCALLGLNGSGKTTLFKAICGLIPAEGGLCQAGGLDITRMGEKKRARYISYIPQRFSQLAGVTAMDAVLMGLNARLNMLSWPSSSDNALAMSVLEKMEIPRLAGEDFSRLSEGQKQLVVLARTLVQNTPVMLMDEPDSALDFSNKHRILMKIRNLIYEEGKAGFVTLHDLNLALAYCDRLIVLDKGSIVSDIRLTVAGKAEVRSCLLTVFDGISLMEHNGKFIALYGG